MLSIMKLTDESFGVIFAKNSQGLNTIDYLSQLNEKYLEGLFQVLQRPGGNEG